MSAFQMGAYGVYVWACFGLTVAVVVICEWQARALHRKIYSQVESHILAREDLS